MSRRGIRTCWRSQRLGAIGRGVLFGLVCGSVLAAAAGARRTDSAYDRFLVEQRAYDVFIRNAPNDGFATFDPDDVIALPQVEEAVVGDYSYVTAGTGEVAVADRDGRYGREMNRMKIIEGRALDPDRADEAVVSFAVADHDDIEVGDRLGFFAPEPGDGGELSAEQQALIDAQHAALPDGEVRVVGIEASPGEFPPHFPGSGWVHLSPALARAGAIGGYAMIALRLEHGQADVPAFLDGLRRLDPGEEAVSVITQAEQGVEPNRSIHLQATAFWILAGLLAAAAVVLVAQVESRATHLDADISPVLGALGQTRRERFVGTLRGRLLVAGVAAFTAVVVAVVLSPLAPIGLARIAEPNPGVHLDLAVLPLGAVAVLLLVPLLATSAAWSTSRLPPAGVGGTVVRVRTRPSWLAPRVSALPSPSIATGVRFAIERGRGRDAVFVRTAMVGVTVAVAAIVATVTFGAGLAHLLDTPRLYGLVWDAQITNYGSGPDLREAVGDLRRAPGVVAVAAGETGAPVTVNGHRTTGIYLDDPTERALPPLIEGRHAMADDEIDLGARTAAEIGADVGDTVDVAVEGLPSSPFLLVGTVVMPSGQGNRLGEGALVTKAGVYRLGATDDVLTTDLFVRLDAGTDPDEVAAGVPGGANGVFALRFDPPNDIVNYGRVEGLPTILGGLVALVATTMLAHTLVTAVRRRRGDLAILKTLGLVRHQVGTVVRWQALTLVFVPLVVGLPVGVAIGRVLWTALARQLGVLPVAVIPWTVLALIVGATVALSLLASVVPARSASRTPAAQVLRAV